MWPDRGNYPDAAPCQAYDVQPGNDDGERSDEVDATLCLDLEEMRRINARVRGEGGGPLDVLAAFREARTGLRWARDARGRK